MFALLPRHGMLAIAVVVIGSLMIPCANVYGGEGLTRVSREATATQIAREQMIIEASGMEQWSGSDRVTPAPVVDRSLLSTLTADLVTDGRQSYDVIRLENTECGTLHLVWRHMAPASVPLPTELPAGIRAALDKATEGMSEDDRKRKYDKVLESYRKSKAVVQRGGISVKMVAAPSARAAHEWLIYESTQCTLPTEGIVAQFGATERINDLGDVAFKSGGSVRMARGNIAVVIRGSGDLTPEAEKLAFRVDAEIAREFAVANLDSMRPHVTVEAPRESAFVSNQKACPITVTVPGSQKVAAVHATVNGEYASVKDNEVLLGSKTGQMELKVSVITDKLLATSLTTGLLVDDE